MAPYGWAVPPLWLLAIRHLIEAYFMQAFRIHRYQTNWICAHSNLCSNKWFAGACHKQCANVFNTNHSSIMSKPVLRLCDCIVGFWHLLDWCRVWMMPSCVATHAFKVCWDSNNVCNLKISCVASRQSERSNTPSSNLMSPHAYNQATRRQHLHNLNTGMHASLKGRRNCKQKGCGQTCILDNNTTNKK
jgi:hypothetical protein